MGIGGDRRWVRDFVVATIFKPIYLYLEQSIFIYRMALINTGYANSKDFQRGNLMESL